MFNTIRDLIKSAIPVTIVTADTNFANAIITDVDDLFIAFQYPSNGFNYVYPLESVIHIRHPISP